MAVTHEELERFTQYATEHFNDGEADSVLQLAKNWTAQQQSEDLPSIRRGVVDADAGRTQSVDEVDTELRAKFDIKAG